jgi:hypothetical protein
MKGQQLKIEPIYIMQLRVTVSFGVGKEQPLSREREEVCRFALQQMGKEKLQPSPL